LCAAGWLGDCVPSVGRTPPDCISRLCEAYQSDLVISDGTAGFHNCELCDGEDAWYPDGKVGPIIQWQGSRMRIYGHGHFLVQHKKFVFLAPVLIIHYILDHWYKPPDMFTEGVNHGRFLSLEVLEWAEYKTRNTDTKQHSESSPGDG